MPFLVMDLEMTGTTPGWHEIIQIGAVLVDDEWNEKDTYLQNVYPENEESFSEPAENVHGLSIHQLQDAPMQYEVLPEFEDWVRKGLNRKVPQEETREISKNLQDVVICGQSVVNDINFLRFAYEDENMKWPFSFKMVDLFTTSWMMFNILKKNGYKAPRSYSLKAVAEHFGLEREGADHNALEDAQLTAACFRRLFTMMDKMKVAEDQ